MLDSDDWSSVSNIVTLMQGRAKGTSFHVSYFSQSLHLPLAVEAGEAGFPGEELLHGGLFEVALLGDEPVQRVQQRIHIAQRPRDGALFRLRWNGNSVAANL